MAADIVATQEAKAAGRVIGIVLQKIFLFQDKKS